MPTTALTVTPGPHPYSQVGKVPTFDAADVSNGNHIAKADMSDDVLVVAHNSGASTRTITITSKPLTNFARTGDVGPQNLAAGEIRVFRLRKEGWADPTSGDVTISANHAEVKIAVIDLNKRETT